MRTNAAFRFIENRNNSDEAVLLCDANLKAVAVYSFVGGMLPTLKGMELSNVRVVVGTKRALERWLETEVEL